VVLRVIKKLGELVVVLLLVSAGTFMLAALIPGDPAVAILGDGHTPEEYRALRQEMGLNEPQLQRFAEWLSSAVRGDLGTSLVPPQTEVVDRIAAAAPVSIELAVLALIIAFSVSVPLAIWSAHRPNGRVDRLISGATFGVLSLPSFLAGLLLIMVAVNGLGVFPRAQWVRLSEDLGSNLHHALLPALTISLMEVAMFTRVLRNDMITTLQEDFILAARAKGMPSWHILLKDALRPSSLSLMTVAGLSVGTLIGSAVIVEYLFAIPGMGSLIVQAAADGDLPMVQGAVIVIAVAYVITNAVIDLSYGYIDPRIRRGPS